MSFSRFSQQLRLWGAPKIAGASFAAALKRTLRRCQVWHSVDRGNKINVILGVFLCDSEATYVARAGCRTARVGETRRWESRCDWGSKA